LNALQMRAHPFHRQSLVTTLDRVEDRQVALMIRFARAEDAEDEALLVGEELVEDVQQLRRHGVTRRLRDLAVELHVDGVEHLVVTEVLPRLDEDAPQFDQLLIGPVAYRVGGGLALDRDARADQVEQQLLRDGARVVGVAEHEDLLAPGHEDTGAVADLHDPHRLELLQRLADARLADLEPLGHLDDGRQPVAAAVVAALDRSADLASQAIGQALLYHWLKRVLHRASIDCDSNCSRAMTRGTLTVAPPSRSRASSRVVRGSSASPRRHRRRSSAGRRPGRRART